MTLYVIDGIHIISNHIPPTSPNMYELIKINYVYINIITWRVEIIQKLTNLLLFSQIIK